MGNRCNDCNKFVGLELGDPEVFSLEVDDEGVISGEVRLVQNCAECGGEVSEVTVYVNADPSGELSEHLAALPEDDREGHTLEIEYDDPEIDDWYQTKDRHGKPIKSFRYQRHMFTATIVARLTCSCGNTFEVEVKEDVQASEFESMW